ncbi:MAG: phosphate ABC transporter permease subunit PstC [Candidatus Methanolliviera hydrocarbonicum]|uniref:Phosphate transport system permease protein n=1 Tax=Candidatus Methanolliviera hydrocarbonicum TaxID=2491085 RepID=A0A520KY11_9EURY|nr:MAG: phosphate ABC transporter permease subunit PstC [Candidatus Methanolliviera hydrocarbonicum]
MRAKFKNIKEKLIEDLLFIAAISSIIVVLFIFIFLMKEGAFAFLENGVFNFIFGTKWRMETGTYGIAPLIIGSSLVTIGAVGFAIVFGIPSAIFLSELAPPRIGNILKPTVELLNSIPSIVYGFIGVVLLLTSLRNTFDMIDGHSFLAGSILLGVMALPTIITISDDAITAVPKDLREGSMALGATRWQTIRRVVLPSAISGIMASILLAVGRVLGETMAIMLIVGCVARVPSPFFNFFQSGDTMTARIASEMGEAARGSLQYHSLFGIGVLLLIIVTVLNVIADIIRVRIQKKVGRE